MPLSDEERKRLAELEQQLESEDPRLAASLSGKGRRPGGGWKLSLGTKLMLVGAVLLLFSISTNISVLSVIGLVTLLVGMFRMATDWIRRN
jgi:uncharacterized membrane protein HdeD (DUF308 family)